MAFVKSKKYPNLILDDVREVWYFRKYSKTKGREFKKNTGVKGLRNQSLAYKRGLDLFNLWLGNLDEEKQDESSELFSYHANRYLEHLHTELKSHTLRVSTVKNHISLVRSYLIPTFGKLRVSEITPDVWDKAWKKSHAEIFTKYDKQMESGELDEDDVRQKCRRFFHLRKSLMIILKRARNEGFIKTLPKLKNPDVDSSKRVYLEKGVVFKIIEKCDPLLRDVAMIAYASGMRPMEICSMEKKNVRFTTDASTGELRAVVTIPRMRAKIKKKREIPLRADISLLLKVRCEMNDNRWVFPAPFNPETHYRHYIHAWRRACLYAGVGPFDMYCLRHSFITDCANTNINPNALASYCGTSVIIINKKYYKDKQSVLETVADLFK